MSDDPEKADDVTSAEDVKPMMPPEADVAVLSPLTTDPDRNKEMSAAKLDDFVALGKYTLVVCIFSELMILQQLSNMLYMVYAGGWVFEDVAGNYWKLIIFGNRDFLFNI